MFNRLTGPYASMQELNLDWILGKIKNMLRFLPDDGAVGQILRRTAQGAEWSNEQGGGGSVDSVNGQTGTVVLTAADVGALPDTTPVGDPKNVFYARCTTSAGITNKTFTNPAGMTLTHGVVLCVSFSSGNSASSPTLNGVPIYPTSAYEWLTNETVMFIYDANNTRWNMIDVGHASTTYYGATKLSSSTSSTSNSLAATPSAVKAAYDLANSKVDAAGAAAAAPVQSVNGQTGAVSLSIPSDTSDLTNTAGFVDAAGAAAAAPVQSVNGQTGAVVISSTGITKDTLWTNPNLSANIAAGDLITSDVTSYDMLQVVYTRAAGYDNDRKVMSFFADGVDYAMTTFNVGGSTIYNYNRSITADSLGIHVSGGYRGSSAGNNYLIPVVIYGYKF